VTTNEGRRGRSGALLSVAAIAALAFGAKVSALGCDDVGSHIYAGEQYDAVKECLDPVSSIDVVTGPDPGSCPAACVVSLQQDGGKTAYLSTMCPPYPVYPFEKDAGGEPLCAQAFAALKANAYCADGGTLLVAADAGDGGG
jgi:hypothetical protein